MPGQTVDVFENFIEENDLVFIFFGAQWCAPCKAFAKVYENISKQFPMIRFMAVDMEKQQDLADYFGICSIPYLMVFKEGIVIFAYAGNTSESALQQLAQQVLDVDVYDLHQ